MNYVIFIFALFAMTMPNNGEIHDCSHITPKYSASIWRRLYGMKKTEAGFVIKNIHRSKEVLDFEPGLLEKAVNNFKVHAYTTMLGLYETNTTLGLRKHEYIHLYHFIHGDSAIFHQFNPVTKEHTSTELGHHTKQYVVRIKQGNWYSADIEQHLDKSYILIGVTIARGNAKSSDITFAKLEDMIKMFPKHQEIIKTIFRNTGK